MGGLTVLGALMQALPGEDFVYLGDTARLPYGTKSPATVSAYACQAARLLVQRGVKALVVACNTASAFALQDLARLFSDIPVFGVVEPGADAAVKAARTVHSSHIVVLATESTIAGGAYQQALLSRAPNLTVYGRSCPLWVTLAEMGTRPETLVQQVLSNDLRGWLGASDVQGHTVLLGCTHFPVFSSAIHALFAQHEIPLQLVDSATTTAQVVTAELTRQGALRSQGHTGGLQCLATDDVSRFSKVGERFLGKTLELEQVELVDLGGLG